MLQTRPEPVVDITAELVEGQLWYDEMLEAVLVKDNQRLTAALFESGIVFTATVNQYRSEYYEFCGTSTKVKISEKDTRISGKFGQRSNK